MDARLAETLLTQIKIHVELLTKCTSNQQELVEHYWKMIDRLTNIYERITRE